MSDVGKELTLVFVKPDGVERGLVGEVISRFERRKLSIRRLKVVTVTRDKAEEHYKEHVDKPFYEGLIDSLANKMIVAMVIEGADAVHTVRRIVGKTSDAEPGTIRGDYVEIYPIANNIVHASDSLDSASKEIITFFREEYYHELG